MIDKDCSVLFLLSSFSGAGGEKVLLGVANELARQGVAVTLALIRETGVLQKELHPAIRVQVLADGTFRKSFFPLIKLFKKESFTSAIATNEHTHLLLLLARMFSGSKAKTVLRIGIPLSLHRAHYRRWKDKFVLWVVTKLYRQADTLIAVSRGVAHDLTKHFFIPEEKVKVVYHPKSEGKRAEGSTQSPLHPWLLTKELPVIVSAGRLRIQKDYETLLKAFAELRESIPARLIIFGEGSEKLPLSITASRLGITEHVSFAGYTDNLAEALLHADVYALSSLWEGLPNTLMEALQLGVPSIASDCPYGPRELLAPKTEPLRLLTKGYERADHGILFARGDSGALRGALSELLSNEAMRAEYSKKAKEATRLFSGNEQMEKYSSILCK